MNFVLDRSIAKHFEVDEDRNSRISHIMLREEIFGDKGELVMEALLAAKIKGKIYKIKSDRFLRDVVWKILENGYNGFKVSAKDFRHYQ